MSRRVAAEPQAVQRDDTGDNGGDRDDQPARVVIGNVVVARVRDQVVGDDVNRTVRHHGGGGGGGDHQCDERARNDGHWCAHSAPSPPRLASRPHITKPFPEPHDRPRRASIA